MQRVILMVIVILTCVLLTGCQDVDKQELMIIEGYILNIADNKLLVAKDITADKYIEIERQFDSSLNFKGADEIGLIYISYQEQSEFQRGDKVKVRVDGIADSDPQQAEAEKISVQN